MDKKLFLLPGLDGTGTLFDPLLRELPTKCVLEVISYPTDQPQTFEQHVEHVAERLPKHTPIILLAESFSGPVAIEILSSGEFQIERVIFVATFVKSPQPTILGVAKHLPLSSLLQLNLPSVLVRYYCFGKKATETQIELFKKNVGKVAPEVLAQRLKILATVDLTNKLKDIKVPCCYIQAKNDKLVSSGAVTDFEKGIKKLRVHRINGPHLILQAEPKACAEVICQEVT
ncbi:serine aminopeptidase domain-containing protein [uncultured Desulfuromonas sp.]|uniref:serine aminopeptidase domain-containing protein n=1 Tax=uncultured Desulfuromonas sp. TaxID=181013 RepID=UPI002AAADA3D|nr:alpha/beta hydrolase [uncultured Desulfuromonas sp.]